MCHTWHAWQLGLRAYVPTWQPAKRVPTSHFYVSTRQRCVNNSIWRAIVLKACQTFNFACQKAYQFFNNFSEEFLNFWIFQFANFKNIWAILENLPHETKNLNFSIYKISLRKKIINLKPFTSFPIEQVGLTEQLLG